MMDFSLTCLVCWERQEPFNQTSIDFDQSQFMVIMTCHRCGNRSTSSFLSTKPKMPLDEKIELLEAEKYLTELLLGKASSDKN